MQQAIWTLADLTPEQDRLLKEAEAALGGGVLLAFEQGHETASELTPSQLECLKGLEDKLGLVLVAIRPS